MYLPEELTDEQKEMITANQIIINKEPQTISQLVTIINTWNKEYLYKIHCSLRFQGNFINHTLTEMKKYIDTIKNHREDHTNFPGSIFSKTIKTNKTKFVLFTNIRLDFKPNDHDGVKPTSIEQNNNIKEAYNRSIDFANYMNPHMLHIHNAHFGKRKVKKYSQKFKSKSLKHKVVKQHKSLLKHIKVLKKMKF